MEGNPLGRMKRINPIHHEGKTVKVTGTLEEEEGDRIIKATRFERVP